MKLRALVPAVLFASLLSLPAWADRVAVLPFSSPKNLPKPELEQARAWTREAIRKKGHSQPTPDEMVSAEAAVRDGVPDTSSEYLAAGRAVSAPWTIAARLERTDYPATAAEEGYSTYRIELEACQIGTGRVESLSREILPGDADAIAEMIALLVRPEGLASAEIPWERAGVGRPKPRPRPPAPPEPAPAPPPPPDPPNAREPPRPRPVYGAGHPFAVGVSIGATGALSRPDNAVGSSWALPIGGVLGYAFPDDVPGLELKANVTGQVVGPRALELSAGARYAIAPAAGLPLFLGPEVLLGTHVALGGDQTARFLVHGSVFAAYAITENLQAELAGDLAVAAGGTGALVLGGGTARFVVRF